MSNLNSTKFQDPAHSRYRQERQQHWNSVAEKTAWYRKWNGPYQKRLTRIYQSLILPGMRVLEIGSSEGDLLAALQPVRGVGVDFSPKMVAQAQARYPHLHFIQADPHEFQLEESFDAILFSDSLNEFWDVQKILENLAASCLPETRIIFNCHNRLWELPLNLVRGLGLATPVLHQNWLTPDDTNNLLYLTGFEVIRNWSEILFPVNIPLVSSFLNRFLVRFWPFTHLALANFTIARPRPQPSNSAIPPTVSVVVAARNEAGNIRSILERVPEMGGGTELVFVEGHSSDHTYETIETLMPEFAERRTLLLRQPGKGKGDAVRAGFSAASGDILMILDADLTVPPEDLPRFFAALASGKGDFINGVRLVYPMEKEAMRFFNLLGNKFFSLAFSWLLGQPIKDTLCGTKVLWKRQYEQIAGNRAYFGDFDPFGDFDLLFGAAKLNFKIVDLPIRYRERVYGTTNIQRWQHGWLLLRMVAFAAKRIKFI
ncbi:MAG: glycosyltransferase [Anaerolineaceae bacterium]|nr:glycosyltransferase [Anaerolineaceae bacterium]